MNRNNSLRKQSFRQSNSQSNVTLDFVIRTGPKAEVCTSVPVEQETEDIDGITIHLLLHVALLPKSFSAAKKHKKLK